MTLLSTASVSHLVDREAHFTSYGTYSVGGMTHKKATRRGYEFYNT